MSNTFAGGLRLHRGRHPALDREPAAVDRILLRLAPGQTPAVSDGDTVGRGALIASATETAPALFAGIGGRVSLDEETVTVERRADVPDAPPLPRAEGRLADMTPETIRGLLLAGGVTPPVPGDKPLKRLIVDCSGDDPRNFSRAALCEACGGDVVGGAKILMKLLAVRQCVFAVSRDCLAAADALGAYIRAGSRMLTVSDVIAKYPGSEPHLLISALFDLEINPCLAPEAAGFSVVSPQLCAAAFQALAGGVPYTAAPITVTAENQRRGKILTVPFGSRPEALLSLCGLTPAEDRPPVLAGGYRAYPARPDEVTGPETEAVTLPAPVRRPRASGTCIGCGRCGEVCPVRLVPSMLYDRIVAGSRKGADRLNADCCLRCACCTAVCPAGLPLAETIAAYQTAVCGGNPDET